MRMEAQSRGALELARWLERHPRIERVYYPGLRVASAARARAAPAARGRGDRLVRRATAASEAAWRVVDATRLISITANLGDTKSTITHPGLDHARPHQRRGAQAAGIGDGLLRVAVGLESVEDLKADLARGLDA